MPTATEARAVDPTRTAVLRRRYAQHYRAMWRRINRAINEYIDGVDFSQPLPLRMIAFNRFVDTLLQREFGQAENDRERGVRAMALAAYMRGITQANAEVEEDMPPAQQAIYQPEHDNAIGALILLLSTQLMGVRTSLAGQLLQRYQQANGANDAKASLGDRIQKAGRTPTDTLAGDGIVRGYNDALLNAYEAAGVNFVGAVPEQKSFWQTMEDDFVCFPADTNVETINGPMPIQNISVGDLIKTRTGYKPALATMKRDYQGQMVIIKAGNKSIVSTANHPYWTLEKGWLNGIDVERGYTLQSFDNELIKVDSVIDFSIGNPDNMPSPIIKILGFLLVFLRILMPIDAINLKSNIDRMKQEIYRVWSDLRLLGMLYVQRCKGEANLLFWDRFTCKLSVATKAAKTLLVNHSRAYSEFFVAVVAVHHVRRTAARFRTILSTIARFGRSKLFPATQALINLYHSICSLAFKGTVVVPVSIRSRANSKVITAPHAYFSGGIRPSLIKTFPRAISSVLGLLSMREGCVSPADGAGHNFGFTVSPASVGTLYRAVGGEIFSLIPLAAHEFFSAIGTIGKSFVGIIFHSGNPSSSDMIELYHRSSAKSISVYNIEVADDNEYYADGILVHNCSYCHQMSQEKDNGYGPGIYTIAQARGLIPAHPRCRCRWRAMPKDFERSQGYTATATSPKWGTWRAPKEIGSDPRLWLYRGGGRKPVKKDDT